MSDAQLEPNPTIIRAHLERLFRRARIEYPEGRCEIAWSDARGAVNKAETFAIDPAGLDAATDLAVRYNRAESNLYVGVNPRMPSAPPFGRASASDVEIAFHQFIDGDSEETVRRLRTAPLPYTWAVTTGRIPNPRPQVYYELEEPTRNMPAWSAMQLNLAEFYAADHVIDPPRIMRLAGTINYPTPGKIRLYPGRIIEPVTLRTIYDGEERSPVPFEALDQAFPAIKPNGHTFHQPNGHDPDTGEVFDEPPRQRPTFQTDRRSIKSLIEHIAADKGGWHKAALALTAHMINRGDPDALILALAPGLTTSGYTVADTHRELSQMIISGREKWGIPNQDEDFSAEDQTQSPLILTPVGILNPKTRAPRDWLVPNRMMRRHITMTTAAPGVGKSTLAIEEAISLASGNDFLNFGITRSYRVAVINNEETKDELERRIEATCQYFQIPPEAVADTLFLYSGVDAEKLILSHSDKNGNVIATPRAAQLRELINDLKLEMVNLDPFVQLNYVEESSNEQISRAMVEIRNLGSAGHPAAIHLVHHNRKPPAGNSHQAGDINSARGASSMGGEAHFFFTLAEMSDADGEQMNIPESDRINFIRLDDAKRKMSPAQGARWFERYGVRMPYGLMGEEVGVLIPRDLDEVINKVSVSSSTEILQRIDEAWAQGSPFSESPQAQARYVVPHMMKGMQLTRQAAKHLLQDWLDNGVVATGIRDGHANLRGLHVLKWPG